MGLSGQSQRWQGQRSAFSWEQSALDHIKAQMPGAEPYRAWQTFTFTAASGHVREVDLFIATPGGLFLVEIKPHPGTVTNSGSTWLFRDGNTTRTIENPLHFTDQKAKEIKSQLEKAAKKLHIREIPRIEAVVFLSAETLKCRLDEFQRQRVYGRDTLENGTGLPGIWTGFLNQPPATERNRVTPTLSKQLPKLMHEIGIARLHRIGRVGPYELSEKSFDSGPTWEDYLAANPSLATDYPRRIRVFLTERTATDEDRKSVQRAAHREYLALQGISHDGIVRAEAYSEELLAGPAVVFRHGANWQRLDHFISGHPDLELDTRLQMIRQLAEALDHAHRRHLYHRALAPRSVYVELDGRYPRLRIADWQVAARPDATTGGTARTRPTTQTALNGGPAALLAHIERSAGPYLAPEFASPESPALLDVFGLGALSYLILTGQPPAASRGDLAARLTQARALLPSAAIDSVGPAMDALVRDATQVYQADRTESVRAFLRSLDAIEEELTAPEPDPERDPLAAGVGDEIAGWTVVRQLGTGSTSRALLVSRDGGDSERVFKVGLNAAASSRLEREAAQLGPLHDSHVARLLNPPFQAGPEGSRRTVIGVEYVRDQTLAEELRRHGPLTIHELERLGEDLFQAIAFLDKRGIWHRDIKPDNLALRELPRKGRELVLFDFSLAGAADTDLAAGTRGYLDPFLGAPSRQRYDQAAELYAVAVTLHEMAGGELPAWGDDLADARFLDPAEKVQLAEDLFDPVARDGLVEFFKVALHRDAARRHPTLHDMTRAWTDIFHDLDTVPPLTTATTNDEAEDEAETADPAGSARAKREQAAAMATPATPLAAAGLSPYALSIAQQRLRIDTAGDLAHVRARQITALRGIGSVPRYELVRRSREWRQRFGLTEAGLPPADIQWAADDKPASVRDKKDLSAERAVVPGPAQPSQETAEDLARLPVDEVAGRLVPQTQPLAQAFGLVRAADGGTRPVSPWAAPPEIARATGLPEAEVAAHLDRLRGRWQKSVRALTPVREELVEILRAHGRVLGWRQLAAGLLARRGAEIGDPAERLRLAAICVRAAVETEERLGSAKMASRRLPQAGQAGPAAAADTPEARVIVALTDAEEEGTAPRADDLFAYAELLGDQADALSARDPLPGVTEIRQALREVDTADHALRLSDTDLVLLAGAASQMSAATPRLELYPRDLPAERAVKISQVGSIAEGALAGELVRRVLARFPDLYEPNRPTQEAIPALLASLGYDVTRGSDSRLHLWPSTQTSGTPASRGGTAPRPAPSTATAEAAEHALTRLTQARQRGGFIALKAHVRDAAAIREAVAALDGITPVNVTAEFVRTLRTLRAVVAEQGRPRWDTVLAADSPDASPAARTGFTQLLQKTWTRLEEHIRAGGKAGIVLLHDPTPLARYTGGAELLARLAVAARDAAQSPVGLWLLCPMEDPQAPPQLDRVTVSVIPGDAEQLYVPGEFAETGGKDRKAS
ncbi:MAG: BREX system serine/threonine kinase PglW [Streptosporangiaceae bacterium]